MTNGTPFNGVAVELYHGSSSSWDAHVIRHCTPLAFPDRIATEFGGGAQHVYGTFSAAKERIVKRDDAWRQRLRLLGVVLSHLPAMMSLLLL
jgi:hypothetical protein